MHDVLLLGAGKVGRMIARLLGETGDYRVLVGDASPRRLERLAGRPNVDTVELDAADRGQLAAAVGERPSVISALSFRFNPLVAEVVRDAGASYYDLTEDVATTRNVRAIAGSAGAGQTFMPQCGLAPGFISIVANHLAQRFDRLDTVRWLEGVRYEAFNTSGGLGTLAESLDGKVRELDYKTIRYPGHLELMAFLIEDLRLNERREGGDGGRT